MSIKADFVSDNSSIRSLLSKATVEIVNYSTKKREKYHMFKKVVTEKSNNRFILPLRMWEEIFDSFPTPKPQKIKRFVSSVELREEQESAFEEAAEFLKQKRTVFLNFSTGFGKTKMTIHLLSLLPYKILWITGVSSLYKQTKQEFQSCSDAKVLIVEGKAKFDVTDENNVYIMGVKKAQNYTCEDFKGIGVIVVDEAHRMAECIFTKLFLEIYPQFIIGLSATPDKQKKFIDIAFRETMITRFLHKKIALYRLMCNSALSENFTVVNRESVINYGDLRNQIVTNEIRTRKIYNFLVENFPDKKIIILSSRNIFATSFHEISENKEEIDMFIGNKKTSSLSSKRILIASDSKGGTGFNDVSYEVVVLESGNIDARQLEGRIRKTDVTIIDIVDNHRVFVGHHNKRLAWYRKRTDRGKGLTIQTFRIDCNNEESRNQSIGSDIVFESDEEEN